jgi:hypothetical protein
VPQFQVPGLDLVFSKDCHVKDKQMAAARVSFVLASFIPSGLAATALAQFVAHFHGAGPAAAVWCAVAAIMGISAGALARDAAVIPEDND